MLLPSAKESVLSLFKNMVSMFDGHRYSHVNALYQFVFTDIDNGFPVHIRFSKGRAEYREGRSEHASIVITTPYEVWLDIAGGFRSAPWAVITKKIRIEGSLSHFKLLPRLLSKKIEIPKSRSFASKWTVPHKTLVLIGSPRKKNGLTSFYAAPLIEGMKEAGTEVEEIYLYEKKTNHCLGCFHCWTKTPGICVQKDDQEDLLKKLEAAELIVYALPLYFHSLPGLVKDHLDRQLPKYYPFFERSGGSTRHPRRTTIKQSVVLFSLCGFPEMKSFEPLVKTFEAYTRHDNFPLIANVLLPGAMALYYNPTERSFLLKKIELLREAGRQIVREGQAQKRILRALLKIHNRRAWLDGGNMYWNSEMARGANRR